MTSSSAPQLPSEGYPSTPTPPPPTLENTHIGSTDDLIGKDGRLTKKGIPLAGTLKHLLGAEIHPVDEDIWKLVAPEREENSDEQPAEPDREAEQEQVTNEQPAEPAQKSKSYTRGERTRRSSRGEQNRAQRKNEQGDRNHFKALVEEASQTVFVDGTNLRLDSSDSQFMHDHPEYPIPTWESTLDPMPDPHTLNSVDRFRQKVWVNLAQGHEAVYDTRHNESKHNSKAMEYLNECQSTGDDSQIRALFAVETSPGVYVNLYTGKPEVAAIVRDAQEMFGTHHYDFQAAWWYELINKAQNEGDFTKAMNRGLEIMNEGMARGIASRKGPKWSESQVMGTLKGLEFMGKSQHLSFKHANIVTNDRGQLEYIGIKGADLMRELTGKFQGYAVGGLSGVDASNLAILAETALQTSLDYARLPENDPARPSEKEKTVSQFILQRFAKQVSDMRMGLISSPGGGDEEERTLRDQRMHEEIARLEASEEFKHGRKDVSIDINGKLTIPINPEKLRTGGAAITGSIWERIAVYSDIAVAVFPNLKYMDSKEMSPVDQVIESRMREYKETHSGEELSPAAIDAYKKKVAREASGIGKGWTGLNAPKKRADGKEETAKDRLRKNREAQKQKQRDLRR